jgi:hypothetical protein
MTASAACFTALSNESITPVFGITPRPLCFAASFGDFTPAFFLFLYRGLIRLDTQRSYGKK